MARVTRRAQGGIEREKWAKNNVEVAVPLIMCVGPPDVRAPGDANRAFCAPIRSQLLISMRIGTSWAERTVTAHSHSTVTAQLQHAVTVHSHIIGTVWSVPHSA